MIKSEPAGELYRQLQPYIVSLPDNASFEWQRKSWLYLLKKRFFNFVIWLQNCLALEVAYGMLFLWVPVFVAAGAILYFIQPQEPDFYHLTAWIVLTSGVLYLLRSYYVLWHIAACVLCVFLGVFAAKFETWRVDTTMLGSDVSTHISGRIVALEKLQDGRTKLLVDVLNTQSPILYYPPERVSLSAKKLPEGLKPGDGINGLVRLFAASGPTRPGGYDFSYYNYYQHIGAQGFFMGQPKYENIAPPKRFAEKIALKIALLRYSMTERIHQALSGETASVAAALITGQRGGISQATNEALRLSGLAHILSISGLHMAMVTGMMLVVIRTLLAFFPTFSSYYPSKKIAAIIALAVAFFYLMLSGADVAAQRSFIMVAVMLFAILCDRSSITMRNLAISALITLIIVPHEVLNPSFQMSFSATAALVAAFGYWSKRQKQQQTTPHFVGAGLLRRIIFPIGSTAMASLIAGLASGIYAAYHFSNAAPFGVISNALAFSVMSFLVMPFALLSSIMMLVGLEWLPLQIMGFGIDLVEKIAFFIAGFSPKLTLSFIPASGLIVLTIGIVILLFCKTGLRLFSIAFFSVAALLCLNQNHAVLLISEDAKMVGVIENHQLFIQRKRPIKFTENIWHTSYGLNKTIAPVRLGEQKGAKFGCDDKICFTTLANGLNIAVILAKEWNNLTCPNADIVVVTTKTNIKNNITKACQNEGPKATIAYILTPQDLAQKGSAVLMDNGQWIFATNGPTRPWNKHRQYSRAARNL